MRKKEYLEAIEMTAKVDFLKTSEEAVMYAKAIYEAIMWGKYIDNCQVTQDNHRAVECKNQKI